MKDVLKEFYKGEIRPEETWPPMSKEQKLRLWKIDEAQQRLLNELSEKEKKEWLELFNEMNSASADDMEQAYIEGMRMGAALIMELLDIRIAQGR